jgi:energy-coupling factor transport system permease protein
MKSKSKQVVIFRYVDRPSKIHSLWAGTKIIALILLTTFATLTVNWWSLGIFGIALIAVWMVSKVPLGAVPKVPKWLIYLVIFSGILTGITSNASNPVLHIGSASVKIGGIITFMEFLLFSIEVLLCLIIISWTTRLGEFIDSISTLGKPFRRIGVPVTEFVNVFALSLRGIPLILEELRLLAAAEKQRRMHKPAFETATTVREIFVEGANLLTAAISSAVRRAAEMSEAMQARGGYSEVVGVRKTVHGGDYWAFAITAIICLAMVFTVII